MYSIFVETSVLLTDYFSLRQLFILHLFKCVLNVRQRIFIWAVKVLCPAMHSLVLVLLSKMWQSL